MRGPTGQESRTLNKSGEKTGSPAVVASQVDGISLQRHCANKTACWMEEAVSVPGGGIVRMAGEAWREKPQEAQTPDSNGGEAPKGSHDRGDGQGVPTFCVAHGGEDGSRELCHRRPCVLRLLPRRGSPQLKAFSHPIVMTSCPVYSEY